MSAEPGGREDFMYDALTQLAAFGMFDEFPRPLSQQHRHTVERRVPQQLLPPCSREIVGHICLDSRLDKKLGTGNGNRMSLACLDCRPRVVTQLNITQGQVFDLTRGGTVG